LQKSMDGAPRLDETERTARTRASLPARLNRRSIAAARAAQAWTHGHAALPASTLRVALAATLRPFTTAERALPVAVAAIVAAASLLALLPSTPAGAVGGVQGQGRDVRLAVNGGISRATQADGQTQLDSWAGGPESFEPIVLPEGNAAVAAAVAAAPDSAVPGPFMDDGTLVTGYAPQTTVEDGSDRIVRYKVKSGETLSGIAHKFGVSMMTLWWANKLTSKHELHVGQVLRIPPVSGLVVTVKDTDTLESLAGTYKTKTSSIVAVNGLEDETLVVGQVLVVPGAKGDPIPTPKPTREPKARSSSGGGHHASSSSKAGPARFSGGRMHWPVIGGGNYVSQYFHYGHGAIDIAADSGAPVVAGAAGRVQFAGWKSNGGGWQVWISHGSGIYTTYNHMSGVSVGAGQWVGKGQRVGRVGSSGWATGPHLHFEVWSGPIWSGGHQVNPMRYF